ncbi:hypothetical protein HPSNT_04290 [Helicobacter pylori SNT49]|uniref:Uncharacterized protein n=1 Tax=Helicobacter pylori SNT49 TaxID=1055530 RepID=G2MC53_HELPX|nr:hypothetical protein HPSNT_04290 [Helicobacter pylori SNT49]
MVSKPPPYPFKSLPSDFVKQSFKNNIKAQQECFI